MGPQPADFIRNFTVGTLKRVLRNANNMKAIEDELCSSRDRPWWVSNYWRDPLETFADMEDEMSLGSL
ncbi:predicted protein [Histoplasma mississippiense (nom. inval.)]|uniref:predicted protein n=1 Tax=Ajellomyces capsulatus (strain NAm1 / WU24) TaxID=2059318 RepID=UPI000157CC00|nr:predicted protein [Histoplasma mississippiense (nom. inval.)]EDN10516.1 predicted protein [Histoplasma mississippiense (nom. inval.)]